MKHASRPPLHGIGVAGAVLVCALTVAGCDPHDRVLFDNAYSSGEIGIVLDGNVNGAVVNDETYTTTAGGHVDPGDVTAAGNNEVIAWQTRRPVTLEEAIPWTNGNEDVTVALPNTFGIPFTVWLLEGPLADRQAQATAACVKLDQIWRDERMGSYISAFTMNDATNDPDAAQFLDFTCAEAADIKSMIGHDPNRINIYYVDRVDFGTGFGTGKGVWCNAERIVAMGSTTSDHLSAHEAGHGFELGHVNNLISDFDTTNVMHNASNNREYLTEGQTFRAHLEPDSAINNVYNLRPGLTTRNCGNLDLNATDTCPEVQKRIWADGTFPAN